VSRSAGARGRGGREGGKCGLALSLRSFPVDPYRRCQAAAHGSPRQLAQQHPWRWSKTIILQLRGAAGLDPESRSYWPGRPHVTTRPAHFPAGRVLTRSSGVRGRV
jgi:hypothetical protein